MILWSSFSALFHTRLWSPLRAVAEGFAAPHLLRRGQDTSCHLQWDQGCASHQKATYRDFFMQWEKGCYCPAYTNPLVVLTDLSRWPITGLERIKPSLIPMWCCWQVPQAPHFTALPGTKQQWGKTLWFCWFFGWGACVYGWVQPPSDGGMLGSPPLPWLAGRWDQTPTAVACRDYRRAPTASSSTTRKGKRETPLQQLSVVNTSATICHSIHHHVVWGH